MRLRSLSLVLVAAPLLTPSAGVGQGIVIDQGRFSVTLNGRAAGSEDFTIRRAGIGRDDAIFANAVVALDANERQEVRPLLRATPPEGIAESYQVEVTGPQPLRLRLQLARRRYVAQITSDLGEEHREFPAAAGTRILDRDVAHHYYFLRNVRPGSTTPVLEPRTRSRLTLEAVSVSEEELRLGRAVFQARRIEFSAGDATVTAWYDQLGRVLRVEIPARGYVAERTDVAR